MINPRTESGSEYTSLTAELTTSSIEKESFVGGNKEKKVQFQEEGIFQPTHETFTPRITDQTALKYRALEARKNLGDSIAPPSSLTRPNYDDSLRRVSVVVYQHIGRCEKRHRQDQMNVNNNSIIEVEKPLVHSSDSSVLAIGNAIMSNESTVEMFNEEHFVSPQFK